MAKRGTNAYKKGKYQSHFTVAEKHKDNKLARTLKKMNKRAVKKQKNCKYVLKEKDINGKSIRNIVKV